MGESNGANTKRGIQIPGSYSDTEMLGLCAWDLDEPQENKPRSTQRKRAVMVVDDDVDQLKFLKRIIERAGFAVVASQSATEALDLLAEKSVGIVGADYKMPELGGVEVVQALRTSG